MEPITPNTTADPKENLPMEPVTLTSTADPEKQAQISAEKERIMAITTNLSERFKHITFQLATPVLSVEEAGSIDVLTFASETPYTHYSIYFFDSAEEANAGLARLNALPVSSNIESLGGMYGGGTVGYTTYDQDALTDDLVGYIDGRILGYIEPPDENSDS